MVRSRERDLSIYTLLCHPFTEMFAVHVHQTIRRSLLLYQVQGNGDLGQTNNTTRTGDSNLGKTNNTTHTGDSSCACNECKYQLTPMPLPTFNHTKYTKVQVTNRQMKAASQVVRCREVFKKERKKRLRRLSQVHEEVYAVWCGPPRCAAALGIVLSFLLPQQRHDGTQLEVAGS